MDIAEIMAGHLRDQGSHRGRGSRWHRKGLTTRRNCSSHAWTLLQVLKRDLSWSQRTPPDGLQFVTDVLQDQGIIVDRGPPEGIEEVVIPLVRRRDPDFSSAPEWGRKCHPVVPGR